MVRIPLLIVLVMFIYSCNRGTLNFFFDGVNQPQESKYEGSGTHSNSILTSDTTDTSQIHQNNQINGMVSLHPAYRNKLCEKCHDVNHAYRLINRQPDICYTCHQSFEEKYKMVHGPVAAGFCTACHQPHQSKNIKLLKMPVREVCQFCHQPGDVEKNIAHQKISTDNCMTCHDAHGGNTSNLLKK